ncbi:MAG: Smr/MutS family protein [Burkholderiales bacterium]|nr:Smr/MutS family protein [Burkholderiales bacterium]
MTPDAVAALKDLQDSLARSRAQRAASELRARQAQASADAAANLFRNAVGDVAPLRGQKRVQKPAAAVPAHPQKRAADEREALAASIDLSIDGDALIDSDAALSYARDGISETTVRDLRRGRWTVQAHLDLHGMSREEARDAVAAFITACSRAGRRCVRIVHGKGIGSAGGTPVLKGLVRRWLAHCGSVLAFAQARGMDGGAGAVLVLLSTRPGDAR